MNQVTPLPVPHLLPFGPPAQGHAESLSRGADQRRPVEPVVGAGRLLQQPGHRGNGSAQSAQTTIEEGRRDQSFREPRAPDIGVLFGTDSSFSIGYLVQTLAQSSRQGDADLSRIPGGSEIGSNAYRRAGADPALYPENPVVVRLSV